MILFFETVLNLRETVLKPTETSKKNFERNCTTKVFGKNCRSLKILASFLLLLILLKKKYISVVFKNRLKLCSIDFSTMLSQKMKSDKV